VRHALCGEDMATFSMGDTRTPLHEVFNLFNNVPPDPSLNLSLLDGNSDINGFPTGNGRIP